jgi:hypothetical protein
MLGHRKYYLPTETCPSVEFAEANSAIDCPRPVFGIFGVPSKYALEINGKNTAFDGAFRSNLDLEFKERMDRYLRMRGCSYEVHRCATVYEIEHSAPWAGREVIDWKTKCPEGFRAPGVDLSKMHERLLPYIEDFYDRIDETEEETTDESDENPAEGA